MSHVLDVSGTLLLSRCSPQVLGVRTIYHKPFLVPAIEHHCKKFVFFRLLVVGRCIHATEIVFRLQLAPMEINDLGSYVESQNVMLLAQSGMKKSSTGANRPVITKQYVIFS